MPFVESSQSLRSRLHLSQAPVPVLVGIAALALLAVFFAAGNLLSCMEGDGQLVVEKSSQDSEAAAPGEAASSQRSSFEAGESTGQADSKAGDAGSPAGAPSPSSQGAQNQPLFVFVSGAVVSPGVYELAPGARAVDAVEAAGGFAPDAATDAVNLARELVDGEQVAIPTLAQVEEGSFAVQGAQGGQGVQGAQAPAEGETRAPGAQPEAGGLVNINTDSEEGLQQLPGIGPATAAKIVASRESEGPFAAKEDLMRVSGIGQKKFEVIQDLICL